MKRSIIVFLVLGLGTSLLQAQALISVKPLPNNKFFGNGVSGAYGLTVTGPADNHGLWISSNWSDTSYKYCLYNVDTNAVPADSIWHRNNYPGNYLIGSSGVAFDGQYFWYAKKRTGKTAFFKITPTGTITDSIIINFEYLGGIAWFDSALWFSLYYPNTSAALYKLNVNTRTIVDTVPTYGKQPQGLTSDGQYIYYVMDDNDGDDERIFAYNPATNDTAFSIALPEASGGVSPRGLMYDGRYLWLIARAIPNALFGLYKYDLTLSGSPAITHPSLMDFNYVRIGYPQNRTLTIQNTGTAHLRIDSLKNIYPNYLYSVDLPIVIPPGQSQNIDITFNPLQYGLLPDTLKIYSNDPIKPLARIVLKGFGLYPDPKAYYSVSSHNFGTIRISPTEAVAILDVWVTNQGAPHLSIDSIVFSDDAFDLLNTTIPMQLDSTVQKKLRFTFEPFTIGYYHDTVKIYSNDPAQPIYHLILEGTAIDTHYAIGQTLWQFLPPPNPFTSLQDYTVEAIRSIPDVTGDGFDDVIIGTENYWIMCLSGNATGTTDTIWAFNSGKNNNSSGSLSTEGDNAQKALAIVNDLNGDGFKDVVCGFGGGNEGVYVLSGKTGQVLWYFDDLINYSLGDITAVHAYGDYNNDGVTDILAVSSATDQNGLYGRRRVYVFNGVNGDSLWVGFVGSHIRNVIGNADLNGDGKNDIVVTTGASRNSVIAYSGQTGAQMWEYPVASVSSGAKEMVMYPVPGEPHDVIAAGFWRYIYRLDGATGAMIWTYDLGGNLRTPNQIILLDDVNGNGFADITAPVTGTNTIVCIDGQTGNAIWSNALPMQTFGACRLPDVNHDGINDIAYACHDNRVYIVSGANGQIIDNSFSFGTGANADAAEVVYFMNDIDGSGGVEIIAGCRNGWVAAISGAPLPVSVKDNRQTPKSVVLHQNYPNPFNPTTTIRYAISERSRVRLEVFNTLGQKVATLVDRLQEAGEYSVLWNGTNSGGVPVASGIYFYRLSAGNISQTMKMIYIR